MSSVLYMFVGYDFGDPAHTLGSALPEQQSRARFDVLGKPDEPENYVGLVIVHTDILVRGLNGFNDSGLTNVSDVDSSSESGLDLGWMVEQIDRCL